MGFGGSAQAMITSLKNNERMRRKRNHFDKSDVRDYGNNTKTEYNLPKATPKVLKDIRKNLKSEQQCLMRTRIVLFVILMTVATTSLLLVSKLASNLL